MTLNDQILAEILHPDNTMDDYGYILLRMVINALRQRNEHDKAEELEELLNQLKSRYNEKIHTTTADNSTSNLY